MVSPEKPHKPARQQWTEFSAFIQADVNETLEGLRLEIEAMNVTLQQKFCDGATDYVQEYSKRLIEYLDKKWGYIGDRFLIVGKWHEPRIGINDEGVLVRLSDEPKDVFEIVASNGFTVHYLPDEHGEQQPVVGMSFCVAQHVVATPSVQGSFQILSFAEPHEISLSFLRPGDNSVVSSSIEDVMETLLRVNALLGLHTNYYGSSFYRQSMKKQQKFLESIIDEAEAVLPAPDSFDSLVLHDAETSVFYIKAPGDIDVTRADASNYESNFSITGKVVGVTIVDILNDGSADHFVAPGSLYAADEGLCFIVRPLARNFELPEEWAKSDMVIPMNTISSIHLTLQ